MKKTTSLLAIVGLLLLSVSLLSNAFAAAPAFPEVPDVKLIIGTGLTPAFDLADFNTGDAATAYNIQTNFLGLSALSGSEVNYASYGAATVGDNVYRGENEGGFGDAANKLKFSTYRINKLPKVGLSVGESVNVVVGNYVSPASPPSFGNLDALIVSDTAQVSAVWADANTVTITALTGATGPVNVDVIAAPITSAPYGVDIDKERIEVCINILPTTSQATANWGFEAAPGKATLVTPTISGSDITYTFASNAGGVKATPTLANRVAYSAGEWYTARIRASGDAGNSHQILLFNFSNEIVVGPPASHVDVAANVLLGTPTSATWIETPVYSNETGTGYPQYQLKAGAAGSITINAIQIVNCAPTLIDAQRGNIRYKYAGGDFDAASDTTQWGQEGYALGIAPFSTPQASSSVANGVISFNFAGAGSGTAQRGVKWTASTTGGLAGIITPASTVGRQVGVKLDATKVSGAFTSLSDVILLAAYGTQSNGGSVLVNGTELIASAEFGRITDGTHYTVANGATGFHQFQFGLKKDTAGVLDVDNVDFLIDSDDPNYGDDVLYP
jgi:hypothetical protein